MYSNSLFPNQRLSTSKKDKKWQEDSVRFLIGQSTLENNDDIVRMHQNYRLINSELEEEEYKSICKSLGLSEIDGKKYIEAFNKLHNIYATLKGEEEARPMSFFVMNHSPNAVNDIIKKEEAAFRAYVMSEFEKEYKLIQKEIELANQDKISKMGTQRELNEFQKQLEEQFADVLSPDEIQKKYRNKLSTKESTINKLMRVFIKRENIRWTKNETFGDAIISGKEFIELCTVHNRPIAKQLNPLNVFYERSPDVPFIQNGSYAGYREELTIGALLDEDGEKFTPKQLKKIENYSTDYNSSYGTTDKFFGKRGDRWASHWHMKKDAGIYPSGPNKDPYAEMILDGKTQYVPHGGGYGNSPVLGGLYQDVKQSNSRYVTRHVVYWKSYRKVGKYSFINEYGELDYELVDEDFYIPEDHKKETFKENKYLPSKTRYVWYDENDSFNSIEWIWLPEVWQGKAVNGDILYDIQPVEHAYQSLLNPYETKIPIYGHVYNSRNASVTSIIDRAVPWQKLYWTVMAKLIKSLASDYGIMTFLNILMVDDKLGLEKTLRLAKDQGLIPYNPLAHSSTGGPIVNNNTMKVAERVDASNAQLIQHYVQLMDYIEKNLDESVGMSPQRLAQSRPYSTATDNEREMIQSMNMTAPLFSAHERLWEQIMQGYMEMTLSMVRDHDGILRAVLDGNEIALLDLSEITMEDEYRFYMDNNNKNMQILQQLQGLSMELLNADKIKLSQLIDMFSADDLNEFKSQVKEIEAELDEREQQMQEREQQLREMEIRLRKEEKEDEQIHQIDSEVLKGEYKLKDTELKGEYNVLSYNMQQDADQDGIPDLLEKDAKITDLFDKQRDRQINTRLRAEELRQRKIENQMKVEEQKEGRRTQKEESEKNRKSKEKIEQEKIRQQSRQTKSE